ncbi:uncharacterized protein LOC131947611 [Physella acuta]|uniref:uncharacterized protein LOC131947611 n=1 Tax=Physella acuta TaxID=109671 RepID=UPI0027DC074F|nr:uncharacterized protein LOC131947611 [Physella acuta]
MSKLTVFILFTLAVSYGVNALTCPVCVDHTDPDSCTGTQDCGNNHEVCELRIENKNPAKFEYHCSTPQDCQNHESNNCPFNAHCTYCCNSIQSCKVQRDDLILNVL